MKLTLFNPPKSRRYLFHSSYFILFLGLGLAAVLYFVFKNQPYFQASIVISMGLFYIIWGTIHHARQGDFHLKIILEYTLVAFIAIMMLLTQIFRI